MTLFFQEALQEKEEFTKPGTANVTPADRKKLSGLLAHYAKMPHPFTACKKDQMSHGLSEEHANRRCAVIKDLIRGTTKWRGKAKEEEVALDLLAEALDLLQVASLAIGPREVSAILHEERLEEGATDILFAIAEDALTEEQEQERAEEVLRTAAILVEAAPKWMLPAAARRPGFRPTKRPTGSGSSAFDEHKHPRAPKGTTTGGKFIRSGQSGPAVTAVQKKLGVATDGSFGKQTKRAVRRFQRKHGLQVDGVVGQQTAAALLGNKLASSMQPGALRPNQRHRLATSAPRTRSSSPSSSASTSSAPKPIASPSEDSLGGRGQRLGRKGWDYHDGMWWPPGHPRNKKSTS